MELKMHEFKLSKEGATAVRVYDDIYKNKPMAQIQTCPDEMVVRAVRAKFKPGGFLNVLDAGCGEGRNAIMMAKEGLTVSCLDTSQRALDLVKSQAEELDLNLAYFNNSITDMPFEEDYFDAIICWRLLYYLTKEEAEIAMTEFRRVLKPDGYLYLSVPSEHYSYFEEGVDKTREFTKGDNGIYMRRYKEGDLPALFSGFYDLQYGIQAQSFLGEPHRVQTYWHALAKKK